MSLALPSFPAAIPSSSPSMKPCFLNFGALLEEAKIVELVEKNFELKPKLSDQINQETKEILYLSDEQIQALKILKNKY